MEKNTSGNDNGFEPSSQEYVPTYALQEKKQEVQGLILMNYLRKI